MHEFRRLFLRVLSIRSRRLRAPQLFTDIHVGERRRAALAVCEAAERGEPNREMAAAQCLAFCPFFEPPAIRAAPSLVSSK
jgi:hypothetical protein